MNRKTFVTLHRYLGLSLAAFLIVSGISGSILAFDPELDAALNPDLFDIDEIGQPALPPAELARRIEATDPRIWTRYVPLPAETSKAIVVYVDPHIDPSTGETYAVSYDEVFVNPVTGEVKGNRMWGECCERKNFVPFVFKLHNRLLLPASIGRPIWGTIAILWALMSLIGLYLSIPPVAPTLRKWSNAWTVKRGLPFPKMNLQLHRATGLWFWIVSLCVSLSGVALALDHELFRPAVGMFSPISDSVWETRATEASGDPVQPLITFDGALLEAVSHAELIDLTEAASEISYSDYRGLYRVGFGDRLGPGPGISSIYVDAVTADIAGVDLAGSGSAGDVLNLAVQPLHSGRIIGMPGRILVFLSGIALALLAVTGTAMWWRRRRVR